jgi:hypothetical protein
MFRPSYGTVAAITAASVFVNASAAEQFCFSHPLSWACDSAAPRPEFPHGPHEPIPLAPAGIYASVISTSSITGYLMPLYAREPSVI